jgi:hypothetical protein
VATGVPPRAVAVSPEGKSVYVPSEENFSVFQYDVGADGTLSPKNPFNVAAGVFPQGQGC